MSVPTCICDCQLDLEHLVLSILARIHVNTCINLSTTATKYYNSEKNEFCNLNFLKLRLVTIYIAFADLADTYREKDKRFLPFSLSFTLYT